MNSLFSWKCHRLFCLRQLMINQQSTTEATEATVYQLSTKPSLLLGFQSSVQHNYFMIRAFWEAPDFLEPSQKEGLALLVDPEGRVTSAIVSQSQGRWGGSSEMQQETKYTATSSTRSLGHITETVFQLGRQHNQLSWHLCKQGVCVYSVDVWPFMCPSKFTLDAPMSKGRRRTVWKERVKAKTVSKELVSVVTATESRTWLSFGQEESVGRRIRTVMERKKNTVRCYNYSNVSTEEER